MSEFAFFIPRWHPATLNQMKGHWSKGAGMKRQDRHMIAAYARLFNLPQAEGKRRVTLLIIADPSKPGPLTDPDAYSKSLNDALVHAKLLKNDSQDLVEIAPVQYSKGTRDSWGSSIILTDLP